MPKRAATSGHAAYAGAKRRRASASSSLSSAPSAPPSPPNPEPTSKPKPTSTSKPKPTSDLRPEHEHEHAPEPNPRPGAPHPGAPDPGGRIAHLDAHRLALPDGDVLYIPDFVTPAESAGWYEELAALPTWHHPTLRVYGRPVRQSRAVAVYAASPRPMAYSGAEIASHAPTPLLRRIQNIIEERLGTTFSTVLLNKYDDGDVYIGRHSDTRENRVIASLSLGAERTFVLTPRLPPREAGKIDEREKRRLEGREAVRFKMADRSLVVMQGRTQDFWKHEIPKERRVKDGRISLTFRQIE